MTEVLTKAPYMNAEPFVHKKFATYIDAIGDDDKQQLYDLVMVILSICSFREEIISVIKMIHTCGLVICSGCKLSQHERSVAPWLGQSLHLDQGINLIFNKKLCLMFSSLCLVSLMSCFINRATLLVTSNTVFSQSTRQPASSSRSSALHSAWVPLRAKRDILWPRRWPPVLPAPLQPLRMMALLLFLKRRLRKTPQHLESNNAQNFAFFFFFQLAFNVIFVFELEAK